MTHYKKKKYISELNLKGIKFPSGPADIKLFEKNNPEYSINVFNIIPKKKNIRGVNRETSIGFYRIAKERKKYHLNLLLIKDKTGNGHYLYIKNLSALLSSQMPRHGKKALHLCDLCLSKFPTEEAQVKHIEGGQCLKREIIFPKDPYLEFNKFNRKIESRYYIVFDSEAYLEPIADSEDGRRTIPVQKHVPFSYAYKIMSTTGDPLLEEIRQYRGPESMKHFVKRLREDAKYIYHSHMTKYVEKI